MKQNLAETKGQKLARIFTEIKNSEDFSGYYSYGADTDRIYSAYSKQITLPEAILLSAFLERSYNLQEFVAGLQVLEFPYFK